jgi:hypothetical protein
MSFENWIFRNDRPVRDDDRVIFEAMISA